LGEERGLGPCGLTTSGAVARAGLIHLTRHKSLRLIQDHIAVSGDRPGAPSSPT